MTKGSWLIVALAIMLSLCACATKRFVELRAKYPVENGRYTILDDKVLDELKSGEINGLYMREIKALMGEPSDRRPYYQRKTHDRFFVPGTTQIRSDDWTFMSNQGSRRIIITFEDTAVAGFVLEELQ